MIDNFDIVKKQLGELAQVFNGFKSEAVQLRIVELILSSEQSQPKGDDKDSTTFDSPKTTRRRKSATESTAKKQKNGDV
jgi:hypothetical protein